MRVQRNAPKIEAVEQNRDQRCDEEFCPVEQAQVRLDTQNGAP